MLDATHDPIGDFVNAATSDVVGFTGRHDFESFKRNTDKLNELETYRQLAGRAGQCGYRINKVVYRGYGRPDRLQPMHDQAIEARTRLQLDRATEEQSQELEDFKLDSQMPRAAKRRREQAAEVDHEMELGGRKQEAELRDQEARRTFQRGQARLEAELRERLRLRPGRPTPRPPPGTPRPRRGPHRLPDPGPRRPRHRAPGLERPGTPAPRPGPRADHRRHDET